MLRQECVIEENKMNNPIIHETAMVLPGAHVYGDVTIGENVVIWFNAVLRADCTTITIGKDSNVQDCCVIHGREKSPVILGERVSIGHGAVLHGCEIDDDVLIGMGSVIMDDVKIGKNCLIAAGTLITSGKVIPENSLVMGSPGKVIRTMTAEDTFAVTDNAAFYLGLSAKYREEKEKQV